jgi:ZIP family zinc transporter
VDLPLAAEAGLWGLLAGGALVLGAAVGWWARVPPVLVALVMAFGAGVLVSALSFDLVAEAYRGGGLGPTAAGFAAGAVVYTAANAVLARRGARHRKRSGGQQPSEEQHGGSGAAIAVGALLDGVPESVVLGVSVLDGGGVSTAVLAAVFISNLPEGLSSAAGMKRAGRCGSYVFGVWIGIALASAASAWAGCTVLGDASPEVVAGITAVAAGAVLTMIADTMLPEAYERAHLVTGLVTAAGFLTAFALGHA